VRMPFVGPILRKVSGRDGKVDVLALGFMGGRLASADPGATIGHSAAEGTHFSRPGEQTRPFGRRGSSL